MKHLSILAIGLLCCLHSFGQIGIGTENPVDSAILHIESSDKGLLIPRLTTSERDNILSPELGLLIFNTDANEFQFWNQGNVWNALALTHTSTSLPGQSVKYVNSNTSTNINTNSAINLPIFGTLKWNDNATLYNVDATDNSITIAESGRYKFVINVNISVANNGPQRTNPEVYITVNSTQESASAATGYMRRNNGHNESSLHLNEILELNAGDVIEFKVIRAGNSGTVNLRDSGTSNVYIEKLI
ncbi:MAG: hypothetical protein BM564_10665 [Bacteroidetes bacterium MedPE-SWsnd-G2]|nr:MAG: hypothetical protein BM564_10665 [Bacteroidetes bacterium MedPE-SWsnd-G2]